MLSDIGVEWETYNVDVTDRLHGEQWVRHGDAHFSSFSPITVSISYAYNANNRLEMVGSRKGQAKRMHPLQRKSSLLSRPDRRWEPGPIIPTASHLNKQ